MSSPFHAKSHQDDYGDTNTFDLPTLMNMEADAMAMQDHAKGSSLTIAPFDPATGVMLSIAGCVITRKSEAALSFHGHTGLALF